MKQAVKHGSKVWISLMVVASMLLLTLPSSALTITQVNGFDYSQSDSFIFKGNVHNVPVEQEIGKYIESMVVDPDTGTLNYNFASMSPSSGEDTYAQVDLWDVGKYSDLWQAAKDTPFNQYVFEHTRDMEELEDAEIVIHRLINWNSGDAVLSGSKGIKSNSIYYYKVLLEVRKNISGVLCTCSVTLEGVLCVIENYQVVYYCIYTDVDK